VTTLAVDFAGGQAGITVLTWGQWAIWAAIGRTAPNDHYFNFSRIMPAPERARPLSTQDTLDALARIVVRHSALRTRVEAGRQGPRQYTDAAGTLPVHVVAAAPGAAEALATKLNADRYWYGEEYPLRVGLVIRDEDVEEIVLGFCHLAADGHGADIVARDLRLAVLGRPLQPAPTALDLVAEQESEQGRQRSNTVITFWTRTYRRLPVSMFTVVRAQPQPVRWWVGSITSPAIELAGRLLAARRQVSPSALLLAATAALVGADNGEPVTAILPIVHNRFGGQRRELVATLAQEGLFVLDRGDAVTFDDLLAPAWQATMRAYRNGYYDQAALDDSLARVSRERGELVHPYCCFNDIRLVERVGGEPPTAEQVAAAAPGTVAFGPPQPQVSCRFCLHVTTQDDALVIQLTADTSYLPPQRIVAFLRALEWLLVESASRPVALDELPERLSAPVLMP
jgi:hypothetical protein